MLLNLKRGPKKELNGLQIRQLIREFTYLKKVEARRRVMIPYYQSDSKMLRVGYIANYARKIHKGQICVSGKNILETINLLSVVDGESNSYNLYLNCIDDAVLKLKSQYARAVVDGELDIFDNDDYEAIVDNFTKEIKSPNSDDLEYCKGIASMLNQVKSDDRLSKTQRESINQRLEKFYTAADGLEEQAEKNREWEQKAKEAEEKRREGVRAQQLAARGGGEEQIDVIQTEPKQNRIEKIKEKIEQSKATRQQKKIQKAEQRQNAANEKAQKQMEKSKAAHRTEQEKPVKKVLRSRAIPYAATLLFAACVSGLFVMDSACANDNNKENKEEKLNDNIKKDKNTVVLTQQDFCNKYSNTVANQQKQNVEQRVAKKSVVKDNASVKSSDKFYDSRLDKFFGAKKADVLQNVRNRMQKVDLGDISAERVAYTIGIYSAYGYNIDVLNNFVNGAELSSNDVKELKNVIDFAKPHGTGVRDFAAAHITSREIHEMCVNGDKSKVEKTTSNIQIVDILKMLQNSVNSSRYQLTYEQHKKLTDLLLNENQDNFNPDYAAELTKLLLLAGLDTNVVNQFVRQNNYLNTISMPDNYVQKIKNQSGQKKPVWYTRCFTKHYAR